METLNASDKFKKNLDNNADLDEIEEAIQRYESEEYKQNMEKAAEVSRRPLHSKTGIDKKKS